MALRAVPDHPKFADLKARLGAPKFGTLGVLEAVWHFCGRFTPRGNIGKYCDAAIESWCEWNGEQGKMIEALVLSGWVDADLEERLLVHDWSQHADKATKQALTRAKQSFCEPSGPSVREMKSIIGTGVDTPGAHRDQTEHGVHTPGAHNSTLSAHEGSQNEKPLGMIALPVPVPVPEPVPVPVPEPEPVPPRAQRKSPLAINEIPKISVRFDEWFDGVWASVRGTANRIQASHAWISVARAEWEKDIFECTNSYLLSGKVADGGGFNPENFLFQQAQDAFRARWPPRQAIQPSQRKSRLDDVQGVLDRL